MSDHHQPPSSDPPPPPADSKTTASSHSHSSDYAPYPNLQSDDVSPPADTWTSVSISPHPPPPPPPPQQQETETPAPPPVTATPRDSNPYIAPPAPPPSSAAKNTVDSVKDVLGKWGKKAAEATKKAEDLAGNMWQHLKTSPSIADAAMGRIAQGTKVLSEGGYEKIFRQNFETTPEEKLLKTYACYLSTSAGPVMGVLYLSSAKLGFCSDSPLSYQAGDKTEWSFYKVVIPFHQLKSVNPSTSKLNVSEKYIQVISVDNHEFWFMGFVNYDSAVKNLKEALPSGS